MGVGAAMTDVLALDIETANYSYEIGGWDKTASFEPSVVATWDGVQGTVYCNKAVSVEAEIKDLHPRTLGDDLAKHVEGGGVVLGHNIRKFDLPILRDALDCWTAGDLLGKTDAIIDTKLLVQKAGLIVEGGVQSSLGDLVKHTLDDAKLMSSHDAPEAWRAGKFDEVAQYCLSDAQLTHDLYTFGKSNGYIRSRVTKTGEVIELEVEW
jgi:DEAD/DEAH box helicase domain-containing protein